MKRKGGSEERQLITAVYEPSLQIDSAVLKSLRGSLLSVEPFAPAIFSVLDEELEQPIPAKRKADDCCDRVNQNPQCRIFGTALSADFSHFEVDILAAHPCGIKSIGGHICTVTYQQINPIVTVRRLSVFRANGNPVVDAKEYACPSNERIRRHTLRFATGDLLGVRFMARIKVASCCDEAPGHQCLLAEHIGQVHHLALLWSGSRVHL